MNWRRRWLRQALGAAGGAALGLGGTGIARPAKAQASLARGLNLSHWFEYERGQALDLGEMRALRDLGFDHVRLPLDPLVCGWQVAQAQRLPFVADLRRVLEMGQAAGLTVVLDLHLEPSDKARLEASAQGRAALVELWSAMAGQLKDLPSAGLAFELYNEPQFYGQAGVHWAPLQRQLLQAVRSHAPQHTVLLTGHQGGGIEGLRRLQPVPDAAVIYVFHYYSPYLFTHQGAHWMETRYTTAGLHQGVRYPSALQAGRPLQLSRQHPRAAAELAAYVADGWNQQRIEQELAQAAQWARSHGVRLVCNEFGVLRAAAEPDSRYRWIGDVRLSLESHGIGWAVWDYTDIFGLTAQSNQLGLRGKRQLEPAALEALLGRSGSRRLASERG